MGRLSGYEQTKEHAVSDEGDVANDAASDGTDKEDGRASGGRTAVVTRPQRPSGKRSRQKTADAGEDADAGSSGEIEIFGKDKAKKGAKAKKASKPKKSGDHRANPFVFVYNYLKQVV